MLTREQILGAADAVTEKVEVPMWGGHIYVRSITGAERDAWEEAGLRRIRRKGRLDLDVNFVKSKARLVALAACDEKGNRVFSDEDVDALAVKNAQAIMIVYEAAARISGITEKDVEEIEKN